MDELALLTETSARNLDQNADSAVMNAVRQAVESIFGPDRLTFQTILLDQYMTRFLKRLSPDFTFRCLALETKLEKLIPSKCLKKFWTSLSLA